MNENVPFFSIVIATYNYGRFLADAIESVLSQSCQDFELIIVDGGSKDNTLDVIKKYEPRVAWWVSEPDKGQSDAFNKGFKHSRGKFLTWLNADDIYFPGALQAVKEKITKHPEAKWATGNFVRFRDSDKRIIEAQWGPHFLPRFLQTFDSPFTIFGPTTFWSREVYQTVGELDLNCHYSMDTEYWLRIMKAGYIQVRVNHDIWAFRMHEDSKTAEFDNHKADERTFRAKQQEKAYIRRKSEYKQSRIKHFIWIVFRILDFSAFMGLYRKLFVVKTKTVNGL